MSGLETAIRNALDRAERGDGQVRARIYQSARQALDAGLRKQGVTDNLVIMQQRKRLEDKISEIENEEIDRLAQSAQPVPAPDVDPFVEIDAPVRQTTSHVVPDVSVSVDAPRAPAPHVAEAVALGGVTRSGATADRHSEMPSMAPDIAPAGYGSEQVPGTPPEASPVDEVAAATGTKGRKGRKAKPSAEIPAGRRGRKKRGFLSHLITWIITLGIVAAGCFIFYQSGMVQSMIEDAVRSANRPSALQSSGQGPSVLSSRGGFSEEWVSIFQPQQGTAFTAGSQARAEIATATEAQALKITSATPDASGDVAIEVPVEILRELAGKSSTLALTIQSAANQHSQISVRCDFGSLGSCSRHRFTATQEKLDALFKVSFDRTMAPNAPGRIIVNTGIQGADRPVFIYSVRALPGQ
ncbi:MULTISPECIES: hypothetical protein [Rhizobiaceae]|uniref:Biotin transporter BioY n=1 Tax=Aliirhizobium cellulosilyticum TaxID=393664 RepID=A0A7W6S7W8_9HYPH|nr:hypothetical protein [Rhizobium cellulosilyticum]MBB4348805.1 hypothetical protein [Rhizobium cellulosilyticum]MBB4412974.1 hypothetical protein [Rhizobium cellulosilyticum]MBB4447606.1 hypothetical protein [Rhizobium cellulosilyticum]